MKTWQQTQIRVTPITATLALATALALGGAGGYAMRAFAPSQDVALDSSTTETHRTANPGDRTSAASIPDATGGLGPVAAHNPGIGLHRADLEDTTPATNIPDAMGLGPVAAHNPGIGMHRLDREELP